MRKERIESERGGLILPRASPDLHELDPTPPARRRCLQTPHHLVAPPSNPPDVGGPFQAPAQVTDSSPSSAFLPSCFSAFLRHVSCPVYHFPPRRIPFLPRRRPLSVDQLRRPTGQHPDLRRTSPRPAACRPCPAAACTIAGTLDSSPSPVVHYSIRVIKVLI